ncbi:MAG: hypothetical protein M1335_04235 [Chloroflexi bacterium]|nr:hypothetical protein [Chloroflexota bacterium]
MKRIALISPALLLFLTGCGLLGGGPTGQVQNFLKAVKGRDYQGALELVSPSLRDKMSSVVSDFTTASTDWATSAYEIKDSTINGDKATVTIEYVQGQSRGSSRDLAMPGARQNLRFFLVNENGSWYIEAISH